ncbi:MAG: hypothetical protein ACP5JJ_16090, partial [Anaerolineae bacterium]
RGAPDAAAELGGHAAANREQPSASGSDRLASCGVRQATLPAVAALGGVPDRPADARIVVVGDGRP